MVCGTGQTHGSFVTKISSNSGAHNNITDLTDTAAGQHFLNVILDQGHADPKKHSDNAKPDYDVTGTGKLSPEGTGNICYCAMGN